MTKKEDILTTVATDLLALLADNLTESSRKELAERLVAPDGRYDSVSARVCRPGKDPYWSGDGELNCHFYGSNIETDEATGDVYRTHTLGFDVSWSSHNERASGDTLAKLHMMTELATVAVALGEKYAGTHRFLYRTAAEEAERKLAIERAGLVSRVKVLAEFVVKGLRVGGNPREVSRSMFADIPEGTYEVAYANNYDTKKYAVRVLSWGVKVWRTA